MGFIDEQIIEQMNKYKKEEYGDIYSGIYIKEELYRFEEQHLFEDRVSVMLSVSFTDMKPNIAKAKYPSEQRPQVIKTNMDCSVNFAFSILEVPLETALVKYIKNAFYNIIKNAQPANVFYENKEEEINNTMIGWFDYKSYAINSQIYNFVFITPIDGKIFHGIFNCLFEDAENWKPVILQVMHSIKELAQCNKEVTKN